jgi:hypothetical protein
LRARTFVGHADANTRGVRVPDDFFEALATAACNNWAVITHQPAELTGDSILRGVLSKNESSDRNETMSKTGARDVGDGWPANTGDRSFPRILEFVATGQESKLLYK